MRTLKRMCGNGAAWSGAAGQDFLGHRIAFGLAGFAVFIGIWFVLGYTVFMQPAYHQFADMLPVPTLKAMLILFGEGRFWQSVGASLRRVLVGLVLAFSLGLPAGILIGFYPRLRLVANAPVQFLRMISPLSWMPIALLLFASFEGAIYFLITIATVWPVLLTTSMGVAHVNRQWLLMAKNQGASGRQLIWHVVLPASLPYIFTSLRLALGVAWIVLVPVEFLGVSSGLGYLINDARDTLSYDRLMGVILAIGILGFVLDSVIQTLQRSFNWNRSH